MRFVVARSAARLLADSRHEFRRLRRVSPGPCTGVILRCMRSTQLGVVALMTTALAVSVGCSEDDCTITLTCPRRAEGGGGAATSAGGGTSAGGTGATGGTSGEGGSGATGGSGGAGGTAPSYVATAVTAGEDHTCALLDDGRIACWGNNDDGQLGDGTFASSQAPVLVATIDDAVALDAGQRHTCALRSDATTRHREYGSEQHPDRSHFVSLGVG